MFMNRERHGIRRAKRHIPLVYLLSAFFIVALACNLPTAIQPTETPEGSAPVVRSSPTLPPPPTPTPQALPPAIIEADPPLGSQFPLQGSLTLYFNQPMDRPSVESAFGGQPALAGRFNWLDETTLVFEPQVPFLPETDFSINFNTTARAANGLFLLEPVSLEYRTASAMRVIQVLPKPDLGDVEPGSAVVATFNQTVVPLGASADSLPQAFTLQPAAPGYGEWVNTSTYIFYPDPALAGGTTYTAHLNMDMHSTAGGPLQLDLDGGSISVPYWSFTTALPRLVSVEPGQGAVSVPLDASITLLFNQSMHPGSVESNFAMLGPGADVVPGEFGWNEEFTTLTYTPTTLLARNSDYNLILLGGAQARGGTPLVSDFSANIHTVPNLRVVRSEPAQGESMRVYSGVLLYFSGPIQTKDPLQHVTLSPEVPNLYQWWDSNQRTMRISGNFDPLTEYMLTLATSFSDPWGGSLGEEYTLRFQTGPYDPSLLISQSGNALFITPQDTTLTVQGTNIAQLGMTIADVSFPDLVSFLAPGGYEVLKTYQPSGSRSWTHHLNLSADRSHVISLPFTPEGTSLPPGLYHLSLSVPEMTYNPGPYLLVSSNVHLVLKLSTTEALVWAVDLRTNEAVSNAPISIYDENGALLASGQTDGEGIFQTGIPTLNELYRAVYAVMAEPGDETFALSISNWSQGLEGYDFGFATHYAPPRLMAYLYTDRPIYRPGQTVYYRAVVRHTYNGRYKLPDLGALPLTIFDATNAPALTLDLPLSEFGTAHGEYILPEEAQPGYYRLESEYGSVPFQVAEYRKPEINLQVAISPDPALLGQSFSAAVNARYFFDAPAGFIPLEWRLYASPLRFHLPGFRVGLMDDGWMSPAWMNMGSPFGEYVTSGVGKTDAGGILSVEIPTEYQDTAKRYTFEVTLEDESGFPVSARAEVSSHPSDFYIGVRPDAWVGQAGREVGFDLLVVDLDKHPGGVRDLSAQFRKVTWVREDSPDPYVFPQFVAQYTPVSSADFTTGEDGAARLVFTPPEPGTYQLDIRGDGARTQTLLWVGGAGQAVWPNLPNQRLQLTADGEAYKPGDTANIFIPNPLAGRVRALVTIERGVVLRRQVLTIDSSGYDLTLPLTDEDAPNIFVAVTLLGKNAQGQYDFRQGFLNLPVEAVQQTLNVSLTSQPERTGPRDEVTFGLRVTDNSGSPVQGEFSLSVVDLATLALADPNAADILPAFYGEQPLGVRTGMALAVYAHRRMNFPGGLGGGGGEAESPPIREEFPDTAYWNAEIVTDANGEAQVVLNLPDSLTTWQVDVRGLTMDTRVGQAEAQVVTTKDLLVRPVTPRFLVVGDFLRLAAIVHNNTDADIQAEVALRADGFVLDDPASEVQNVSIPARGRQRVEWWGTVQDGESVDLIFSARGGGLEDVTRPVWGALPVLRYTAPQTFGTAGTMVDGGERLELVSLPSTFDPTGGNLRVELAPSLAAAMITALDVLEHYPYECTEQTLSRFLPNLEAYHTLLDLGIESPDLQNRLQRTLGEGMERLINSQNEDGGWGWWSSPSFAGRFSDPYVSAYVLFGLSRARAAGIFVDDAVIQAVINYLLATLPSPQMLTTSWQLDRLAFQHFALASAGAGSPSGIGGLYNVRDQLNPWAKAFLALSMETLSPGDQRVHTLLSDLESTAIRSGTGSHWEQTAPGWRNMSTTIFNSAVVVYAIAQNNPSSATLPEAVRYLMAHRTAQGGWSSTYESAWTILALTEVMKGSGELSANFSFGAALNGIHIASGQTGGGENLTPVSASVPVSTLYAFDPNALVLQRDTGGGRLYYTAHLNVLRPVEDVAQLDRGISVSRSYHPAVSGQPSATSPIQSAQIGELVTVRLSLVLQNDAFYLVVEDYIPAGAEILDTSLKTSQLGIVEYEESDPFAQGWGWWNFNDPQTYDDHIAWAVDYLPAGTYELTYTLVLNQPGQYRVLPARAWQFYFSEVQGNSAGEVFGIGE